MKIFLLSFLVLMLCCCSKDNQKKSVSINSDTVSVGMTYSEVEDIKGKPTAIERGYRTTPVIGMGVDPYEESLFVTWVYHNETKIDTFTLRIVSLIKKDTTTNISIKNKDYCILFDAASGRVVKWGFYPFKVISIK